MNGPSHYRRAESLVSLAALASAAGGLDVAGVLTDAAQVHATLAVAAAVAGLDSYPNPNGIENATGRTDRDEWAAVTHPPKAEPKS